MLQSDTNKVSGAIPYTSVENQKDIGPIEIFNP